MIIDHIFTNIKDADVQQTLLKKTKTFSLDDIEQICRAAEMRKFYKEINCNKEINKTKRIIKEGLCI